MPAKKERDAMLVIIENKKEIKKYVDLFRINIKKRFGKPSLKKFTFPGGGSDEVNFYHIKKESRDISIGIPKTDWNNRFVHLVNIQLTEDKNITPDVEINFPFTYNKNTAGCLVKDTKSENILLCHRGKFNAYKGMIPLDVSKKFFKSNLVKVFDGEKEIELISITQLDSSEFIYDIYNFTDKVLKLKKIYKSKKDMKTSIKIEKENWWDSDEFEGIVEKTTSSSKIEYSYLHGEIQNCLFDLLKEKFTKTNFSVKSNKNVDLAILEGNKLKSIFEVKTSGSFSNQLYKAIGQLFCYSFYYSSKQNSSPKLFLVIPNDCYDEKNKNIMEKLNISIILYREGKFFLPDGQELNNALLV